MQSPAFIDRTQELARAPHVTHVLKADIADFFPHIYHHRLETRLHRSTTEKHYADTIMRMLSSWGGRVSYGLPIGPAASRLLAELLLDPIDRMLQEQGYKHCRWIDDIRLFCESKPMLDAPRVSSLKRSTNRTGLRFSIQKRPP
jgi:Reverse transcriptase (RNA-dependent DNA polymerase)